MTVKGLAIPAYDPRGIKGMGLAYATSNRGACHLRAYTPAAEVIGNVLGPSTVTDPLAWKGKGKLTVIFQHVHTVTDCLDVCKFATFAESLDTFAAQFSAITGMEADAGYLLKVGERVWNLERYYNNLNGFREGSDYLPKRLTTGARHRSRIHRQRMRAGRDAGRVLSGTRLDQRGCSRIQADRAGDSIVLK